MKGKSKILSAAQIAGVGVSVPYRIEGVPAGMAPVVLLVPLEALEDIVTPYEVQQDLGLPWHDSVGKEPVWFNEALKKDMG